MAIRSITFVPFIAAADAGESAADGARKPLRSTPTPLTDRDLDTGCVAFYA